MHTYFFQSSKQGALELGDCLPSGQGRRRGSNFTSFGFVPTSPDDIKWFLIHEWNNLKIESSSDIPIENLSARIIIKKVEVPQQTNTYDCGLFVLYFMELFLKAAPERFKMKDLEMFGKKWFKPEDPSAMREKIQPVIKEGLKRP